MTIVPAADPLAFDALLSRTWALFKRNWIVAMPIFIAAGVTLLVLCALGAVCLTMLLASKDRAHPSDATLATMVLAYIACSGVAALSAWWAMVAMFGMADAAWARGSATFRDGNAAFRCRAGATIVAAIGLIGVFIAALVLALPTLGLALLALPLVTMYVMPSVVGGRRGGFEAIGESFRLVRRFFVPSLITVIVLLGIQYAIGVVGGILILPVELAAAPAGQSDSTLRMPPIPLLIPAVVLYLISLVAGLFYYGFYAVAITGMYRSLVAQTVPPPPGAEIVAT